MPLELAESRILDWVFSEIWCIFEYFYVMVAFYCARESTRKKPDNKKEHLPGLLGLSLMEEEEYLLLHAISGILIDCT